MLSNQMRTFSEPNTFGIDQILRPLCRICWQSQSSARDPLVRPCHCSGTIAFIHERCLLQHMYLKTSGKLENAKCQLCGFAIVIKTKEVVRCEGDCDSISKGFGSEEAILLMLLLVEIGVFLWSDSGHFLREWREGSFFFRWVTVILAGVVVGGVFNELDLLGHRFIRRQILYEIAKNPSKTKQANKDDRLG